MICPEADNAGLRDAVRKLELGYIEACAALDECRAENARLRNWLLALHGERHGDTEGMRNQAALAVAQWIARG